MPRNNVVAILLKIYPTKNILQTPDMSNSILYELPLVPSKWPWLDAGGRKERKKGVAYGGNQQELRDNLYIYNSISAKKSLTGELHFLTESSGANRNSKTSWIA